MAYVPAEKQVMFVAYKLKGGAADGEINCKSQEDIKASHP